MKQPKIVTRICRVLRFIALVILAGIVLFFIWLYQLITSIRLFRGTFTFLHGNEMKNTAFGMVGCVHGMYCQNSETYDYGIAGLGGVRYFKQWGYNF